MARHLIELTPEEKHRIYLEERVRFQAKKRIRRETSKRRFGWLIGLGVVFMFITTIIIPEREAYRSRSRKGSSDSEEEK